MIDIWNPPANDPSYDAHQAERDRWFANIAPKGNWKLGINTVIAAKDFANCNAAAIFFTGAGLSVLYTTSDGLMVVSGPGYYATVGA